MSVICQCPSCKAKYQVGDQYAGRKIKCPKCSAAVNVPAAAPPTPAAPVVAAASVDSDEEMAFAQSGDDSLGFLKDDAAARVHQGERSGKHRARARDSSVLGDDLAKSGIGARAPASGHGLHAKKKKKSGSGLLIAGIAVGCLAIVGVVGGAIYFNWQAKTHGSATAADDKKPVKPAVDPNVPMIGFTFKWPESERSGATLTVNGELTAVPASGEFKIKLPKILQPYHFVLERKGFLKQEFSRPLTEDDDYTVTQWQSENRGIDWEQDFTAAKKLAADQHKNLLIVFDASDAKASAFHSSRFNESVAASPDFVERAGKEYICVYIDNPEKDEAKKKVRDLNRNKELTKKFRITVFPTVVVTDADARPFGIMEDYTINGVTPFLALMDKWQTDRSTLFDMLDRIKSGGGKPDAALLKRAISFLEFNKLDGIYQHTIQGWADLLPKGESNEVTEQEANGWMMRFAHANANPDNAKKEVEEFDRWKAKHSFKKHPDVGATLHAFAAALLMQIDEKEAAKKKYDEAKAFPTKSARVRHLLAQIERAITGKQGEEGVFPHGSGSGFCIADGNYVMTNHHVIAEAKKVMVHLNGDEERYLAHVVADNPEGDMAILKIDLPQDKKLKPIPFAAKDVKIGDEVCAFGWPGLLSENSWSTLTNGLVSGIDDREGFLITNCKIEHGNSGGPLCSVAGCCIAGMNSRKTGTGGDLSESYGMAIPASKLIEFIKENKDKFPSDFFRKIPHAANTNGSTKLSEVVERLQPSCVYVENYQ
jgi:hypothetical protein